MRRVLTLLVLGLAAAALRADDGPVTIKIKQAGPGDRVKQTKTEENSNKVSFTVMGTDMTKEEKAVARYVYTEEVLERPAGAKRPTKLKRTYESAEMTKDGEKQDLGLAGKTVVIEKSGAGYTIAVDGQEPTGPAGEILKKEFNKDPTRLLVWAASFVRNGTTTLALDEVLDLAFTGTAINANKVENVVLPGDTGMVGGLSVVTLNQEALDAISKDLADDRATAVSLSPGWLRSEAMLEHFGVTEANWRDGTAKDPHFCISETPHYVARAAVALAADPERVRFNGQSLASWDLGRFYGVTDLDGTQPHMLRYHREVTEAGRPADDTGYR